MQTPVGLARAGCLRRPARFLPLRERADLRRSRTPFAPQPFTPSGTAERNASKSFLVSPLGGLLNRETAAQAAAEGHHVRVTAAHHFEECAGVASHRRFSWVTRATAAAPVIQAIDHPSESAAGLEITGNAALGPGRR